MLNDVAQHRVGFGAQAGGLKSGEQEALGAEGEGLGGSVALQVPGRKVVSRRPAHGDVTGKHQRIREFGKRGDLGAEATAQALAGQVVNFLEMIELDHVGPFRPLRLFHQVAVAGRVELHAAQGSQGGFPALRGQGLAYQAGSLRVGRSSHAGAHSHKGR
jgi:hypothetical protein